MKARIFIPIIGILFLFTFFIVVLLFSCHHDSVEFNIRNETPYVIDSMYVANIEWDTAWVKNILPFRCTSLDLVFKKKENVAGLSVGWFIFGIWSESRIVPHEYAGSYYIGDERDKSINLRVHIDIDQDSVRAYKEFDGKIYLMTTRAWEEINRGE